VTSKDPALGRRCAASLQLLVPAPPSSDRPAPFQVAAPVDAVGDASQPRLFVDDDPGRTAHVVWNACPPLIDKGGKSPF